MGLLHFVLWRILGLARILIAKPVSTFAEYALEAQTLDGTLFPVVFVRNRRGHNVGKFARVAEFRARNASALAT
jgi:hypothetical protein